MILIRQQMPPSSVISRTQPRRRKFLFFLSQKDLEPKKEEIPTVSPGGKFFCTLSRSDPSTGKDMKKFLAQWRSSGSPGYHLHSPLIAKRRSDAVVKNGSPPSSASSDSTAATTTSSQASSDASQLGLVMTRSKKLPSAWYYSSNHIMINDERIRRAIPPLIRRACLDEIAREHAARMAAASEVHHSDPEELFAKLEGPSRRVGQNVAKGSSIKRIHKDMMKNCSDRNNMLDRRYTLMGMGTARGPQGELYLCQVFRS